MDYTDGTKEAKLLQELLHLIEEAVFRGGGSLEGNLPDVIMKEMQKKGFAGNDFSFTSALPRYTQDYHRALVEANIPYLRVPDIHGNTIFIVRTEDSTRLLDIDATIKKGSSHYTRTEYIKDFIQNEQALGREIYRMKMSEGMTHEILANKSFDHEHGFVTSYHDGYCYFSESAVDSEIASLFLDTAVSAQEGSFLWKIKQMNYFQEQSDVSTVLDYMRRKDTRAYVNAFDNRSDYLLVENGELQVHSFTDKIDTVVSTYRLEDYVGKEEALEHIVTQELTRVHNCESMKTDVLAAHLKLSEGELAEKREKALLTEAELLADLKDDPSPASFAENGMYLAIDKDSMRDMFRLLKVKQASATDPTECDKYKRLLKTCEELSEQKTLLRDCLNKIKEQLKFRVSAAPNYKFLSAQEKLEFQLQSMTYILQNSGDASLQDYLNKTGTTRDELVQDFRENFSKFELYASAPAASRSHAAAPAPAPAPI